MLLQNLVFNCSLTFLYTVVQCCTNYPVHGGKNQTASQYCEVHAEDHVYASDTVILTPSQGSLDITCTGSLPENDDDSLLVGCKCPENRTKFYDTTAGMLALIRPCGIVVAMCEMRCTHVSQSPRYFCFCSRHLL